MDKSWPYLKLQYTHKELGRVCHSCFMGYHRTTRWTYRFGSVHGPILTGRAHVKKFVAPITFVNRPVEVEIIEPILRLSSNSRHTPLSRLFQQILQVFQHMRNSFSHETAHSEWQFYHIFSLIIFDH